MIVRFRHTSAVLGVLALALPVPLGSRGAERDTNLLKISVDQNPEEATLRLEGRVTGPWVDEFKKAWASLCDSLGRKKLWIDLRGVTHMNTDGKQVLAEIHSKTGAEFIADTPMTKYFADEARRGKKTEEVA